MERLSLPKGKARESVLHRGRDYRLRESESAMLATVGTFRVVRAADLQPVQTSRDVWTGDLRSLAEQGLVELRTVEINRQSTVVAVLTREGKALLDAHRTPGPGRLQEFHAGLVKPRELAHDAQLYRLFQAEAARIHSEGGTVTRIALDYELKRDYQRHLHRPSRSGRADGTARPDREAAVSRGRPVDPDADRPTGHSPVSAEAVAVCGADRPSDERSDRPPRPDYAAGAESFAHVSGLPVIDGHLELPDLRIEYETADGRLAYRDVELVTEYYSRAQLAGKTAAGFAMYRAAGAGRLRGQDARRGGTPSDPHYLEFLR